MKTSAFALLLLIGFGISEKITCAVQTTYTNENLANPGGSNLISDWITVHIKTIRSSKVLSQHFRQLAYTGVALYESVVSGDRNYRSLAGQLNGFQPPAILSATGNICWPASANAAMADMFRFFYPQNPADITRFDSLENAWKKRLLSEGNSETAVDAGEKYGSQVALTVIDWSKGDGFDKANKPYIVPQGQGLWEPAPPLFIAPIFPYLGNVRTFVAGSTDNATPPPPPPFSAQSESDFYKMNQEVLLISQQMDEERKATVIFWDDFPDGLTVTAGGHWASILKTLLNDLNASLIEGARLYAGLFITMNDAIIGCFRAKYMYNQIRPVTYIRKYMDQKDWLPIIITPPHPEYPAAHAVVSMASATILTKMLGDNISITDNTYSYRGYKAHHFNSFVEAGREAGMSRLYGGIHYRNSIEAGFSQGEQIAGFIGNKLAFKNSIK